MYVDIYQNMTAQKVNFAECVRDQFGQSVLDNVLDPMLSEVSGLVQMQEEVDQALTEIDQINEELQSIK